MMSRMRAEVAVLVVGFLVPGISQAEYPTYGSSSAAISGAQSAVGSLSTASSLARTGRASEKSLEEVVKETANQLNLSQIHQKRLQQLGQARKASDDVKNVETLLAISDLEIAKRREQAKKELNKTIQTVPVSNAQINPADLQSTECPVDSTQFVQLSNLLNSEPIKDLKKNLSEESSNEQQSQTDLFSKFAKLLPAFEESIKNKKSLLDEETQKKPGKILSKEEQIKDAEKKIRFWEQDFKDRSLKFLKSFFSPEGFLAKLINTDKDDKKVVAAANQAADIIEHFRQGTLNAGLQIAKTTRERCENGVNKLLRPNGLVQTGYRAVLAKRLGDTNDVHVRTFWGKAIAEANAIQCYDAANDVNNAFGSGSQLAVASQALRSQFDAKSLRQNISTLVTALGSSFASAMGTVDVDSEGNVAGGNGLKMGIQGCAMAARKVKEAQTFVQQNQTDFAQAGSSEGRRRGRSTGRRNGQTVRSQSSGANAGNFSSHGSVTR